MPKIRSPNLPPEHRATLKAYVLRNGRFWKRKLLVAWSTGRKAEKPEGPLLREVRNRTLAPAGPQPFPHRLTQTQG